jgi:hypothetical protein
VTKLAWDKVGERRYETGVDHGVLYIPDNTGDYTAGYAWNGLVSVTESPSGAEPSPQYADNIKYLNLTSVEEFGATIEAFTYPDEFGQCDGTAEPSPGLSIGQQPRKAFGLSYRTKVGNDLNSNVGYKLHLVYGAMAAPSEKAFTTVNDSPEAVTFSWEVTTTAVEVPGFEPSALLTVDSTKVNGASLAALEDLLYGTAGTDPSLPSPAEVIALFEGTVTSATPTMPTYNSTTKVITIPTVTGVVYKIDGEVVTGEVTITEDTIVTAEPAPGYKFPAVTDDDWFYDFA